MEEKTTLICTACHIPLTEEKTHFSYLGHAFSTTLLQCPGCGQVFIPEELARGRMAEVEQILEDK